MALGRALAGLKRNEEAKTVPMAGIDVALSGPSSGGRDLVPEMRALIQTLGLRAFTISGRRIGCPVFFLICG